jgi:chromosome segregation ATPase
MSAALQGEVDVSKMLLDNSAKEIERRNMRVYNRARALNKLARLFLDRLKKINAPEQVTYDTLSKFAQDIQRVFIVADIDIKNWFPRISPFFIMDRRKFLTVHEKAKITFSSLNDFLTEEYVKTKTLEEIFQLINELHTLENQLSDIEAQQDSLRNERVPLEKEIALLEQKIARLKTQGPIDQLNLMETEAETLNSELKHALRHLQKPFIKMQALAFQGGGAGLTQDELKKLSQYLETPLEAIASEEAECPMLKRILQKLATLMSEEKVKLKSDKARKAGQSLDDILKRDSLAHIHKRCVDVATRRTQLLSSAKMDEIKRDLAMFQEQIEQLRARKTSVEAHEAVKEHALAEAKDRIRNHKHAIERNVHASLDKSIHIL